MSHLIDSLCTTSVRQRAKIKDLDWPDTVDQCSYWGLSPELVSLHGTRAFNGLTEAGQRALSHLELANFFSLNIHGEKRLIAGVAMALQSGEAPAETRYLLHFIEEEARHLGYFSGYCERYGEIFPERVVPFSDDDTNRQRRRLVLFGRILIFETLVDEMNRALAVDVRIEPVAREINRRHHVDESRHLAFGRAIVAKQAETFVDAHPGDEIDALRDGFDRYLTSIWRDLANPTVYARAGLADPYALHLETVTHFACRDAAVRASLSPLTSIGLLTQALTP